jgi:hypothetical protein
MVLPTVIPTAWEAEPEGLHCKAGLGKSTALSKERRAGAWPHVVAFSLAYQARGPEFNPLCCQKKKKRMIPDV